MYFVLPEDEGCTGPMSFIWTAYAAKTVGPSTARLQNLVEFGPKNPLSCASAIQSVSALNATDLSRKTGLSRTIADEISIQLPITGEYACLTTSEIRVSPPICHLKCVVYQVVFASSRHLRSPHASRPD
jgi:hypothetical protein